MTDTRPHGAGTPPGALAPYPARRRTPPLGAAPGRPARRRTPRGPRGQRGPRARSLLAVLGLCVALALAGCSGSSGPGGEDGSGQRSTVSRTTLQGRWPLTGLPAHGKRPSRPVLVTKVDNTANSRPQLGLGRADLVTEELVEGGSTRLAAFFYQHLPEVVGPVRSFRDTDVGVVKPTRGLLVASGGAPSTVRRVHKAGVRTVTEGGTGFYRDSARRAPYNLFMHLPRLAKSLKKPKLAPRDYLPWGQADALPKGRKARAFQARFSPGQTTRWRFGKNHYERLGSRAAQGQEFRPSTVLVLRVREGTAGYLDPAGNPVPKADLTGSGAATVFHGGRMVRATWVKKHNASPVHLRTRSTGKSKGSKAGSKQLRLPPGRTWVELVPRGGGGVSVG